MANILTALTEQAVTVFRSRANAPQAQSNPFASHFFNSDPVLQEAQQQLPLQHMETPGIRALIDQIFSDPEFDAIAPHEGQLDPMVLYPGGGMRGPSDGIIKGIFSAAFLQIYYLRQPNTENTFVRNVLEGFEELRRAIRGERVRSYLITGIGRLSLPEGSQVTTPWGIVKPASTANPTPFFRPFWQPQTTCILAEPKLWPVHIDRSPNPQHSFDIADQPITRSHYLFPLACALASKESANPVVPLVTWTTSILPFMGSYSYSTPLLPPVFSANMDFGERTIELEEWTRIVDRTHAPNVDVAARRVVSAVAHRNDKSDSLIDAVMVWENLLGTSNEVTFRVSAALTKLIEKNPNNRLVLRKRLSDIYAIRSRLVHGSPVDPAELNPACDEAIDVAIQALRACYKLGPEWLSFSSNDRSNKILLEWP